MKSARAFRILLFQLVLSTGSVIPAAAMDCTFRVVNKGPQAIVSLQIAQSGKAFGANLRSNAPLLAGRAQPYSLVVDSPLYDVRATFQDGFVVLSTKVNVCANDLVLSHG